jgi:hypothetical protein
MSKTINVLLISLLALGLSGCSTIYVHDQPGYAAKEPGPPPWAPAHGYRAKHHYYYYPASAVYFDVDRKLYFYAVGAQWRTSTTLPAGVHIDVASYTTLDMDNDRPYVFHDDVVKRYPPGQLKKVAKGKGKKWD